MSLFSKLWKKGNNQIFAILPFTAKIMFLLLHSLSFTYKEIIKKKKKGKCVGNEDNLKVRQTEINIFKINILK